MLTDFISRICSYIYICSGMWVKWREGGERKYCAVKVVCHQRVRASQNWNCLISPNTHTDCVNACSVSIDIKVVNLRFWKLVLLTIWSRYLFVLCYRARQSSSKLSYSTQFLNLSLDWSRRLFVCHSIWLPNISLSSIRHSNSKIFKVK